MGSVILPPWKCPECWHTNVHTTARCMNRRYDETSRRFNAIPAVPHNYSLQNFGEYLEKLGVAHVAPPAVVWECPYVHPCLKPGCEKPGRAYSHGIRCEDHKSMRSFGEEADE